MNHKNTMSHKNSYISHKNSYKKKPNKKPNSNDLAGELFVWIGLNASARTARRSRSLKKLKFLNQILTRSDFVLTRLELR